VSLDAILVPAPLRDAVSDRAWVAAMLEAERALVNAEAIAGVIPAHAAGPVSAACDVENVDVEAVLEEGRRSGNPAEPLVRALRFAVGGEAAEYVHYGATSQDIVDTAAMLVARNAVGLVVGELDAVAAACARLSAAHRDTPMAARTLLQQAVPTTFGLKAAGWLLAVLAARDRLRETRFAAQLGGAAGTLAALGPAALEAVRLYAHELELRDPGLPWHTDRTRVAELGGALAVGAGVCAKIGLDVALLEQTEVGEVHEPPGAGGSSTMPHKRNPVGSVIAVACARRTGAAASVLTAALVQEHERPLGSWQSEWGALSDALAYAGGAVSAVRETLDGLEVDSARMRANLDLTGGAILSEQLKFEGAAGDPEGYLGVAGELVDRALAAYGGDAT
jgi:3-carboxy-cis,cis-muconate cycloisomerase